MQSSTSPVPTPPSEPATQSIKADEVQTVDEKKESPSADGYANGEGVTPMQPMPPMPVNGGMPPQQVYINTAMGYPPMAALESQFHTMTMNDIHHSAPPSEAGDKEQDGDQPVKLFVGQVRTFVSMCLIGESCEVYDTS